MKKYKFTNFKNFADAQIDLSNPLTILIGKNGSGKSNLIEGIEVFAHLAKGTPLCKFSDVGDGGDCEVRGGLSNCVGLGSTDFELCFDGRHTIFPPGLFSIDYRIKIGGTSQRESNLLEERLLLTRLHELVSHTFFDAQRNGDMLEVEYDNFSCNNDPYVSLAADRSVISRYGEVIAASTVENDKRGHAPVTVRRILDYLQSVHVFDTNPKAMRGYKPIAMMDELSRDGSNLSTVICGLRQKGKLDELERITKIAGHLLEDTFSEIDYKTEANNVMLILHVGDKKANKRLVDARMLSDSTLRLLAVLTALETVRMGSRVVIEEFDSGLHPSRARLLVKHLYKMAKWRELNLLVTTQNPAFMNALNEEQMKSVVLCHRDPESGHSNLTPFMDIEDVDLMMLRGSLGDLVTGEIVEKYLSSEFRDKREEIAQELVERYNL